MRQMLIFLPWSSVFKAGIGLVFSNQLRINDHNFRCCFSRCRTRLCAVDYNQIALFTVPSATLDLWLHKHDSKVRVEFLKVKNSWCTWSFLSVTVSLLPLVGLWTSCFKVWFAKMFMMFRMLKSLKSTTPQSGWVDLTESIHSMI